MHQSSSLGYFSHTCVLIELLGYDTDILNQGWPSSTFRRATKFVKDSQDGRRYIRADTHTPHTDTHTHTHTDTHSHIYIYIWPRRCANGGCAALPEIHGFDSRWCHWDFLLINLPGRTVPLGSTQNLTEMSTRNIFRG